jgi:hypothetical protein
LVLVIEKRYVNSSYRCSFFLHLASYGFVPPLVLHLETTNVIEAQILPITF